MNITVVSVGARPKLETAALINDFLKRLPKHVHVQWQYIKHGSGDSTQSKLQEAELILRALPPKARIILLDENGRQLSSPQLADCVFKKGGDVTFIIGGAYGVVDSIKKRAELVWSLGRLVYPHQLVRIILAEQLYRSYAIYSGHPYHHA